MTRPFFAIDNGGITRHVILLHRWAIKIPRINYGWSRFLQGLGANIQEETWWGGDRRLCPVVGSVPGGWLIVMPRAQVCTAGEVDYSEFRTLPFGDFKPDNFGWVDGRVVLLDYGSHHYAPVPYREALEGQEESEAPRPEWDGQWCKICGQNDKTYYTAPDELWNKVVPRGINIVCLSCLDDLCAARGIDYAPQLLEVGFIGHRARANIQLLSIPCPQGEAPEPLS